MHKYHLVIRQNPTIDHHRFDAARAEILARHNETFKGNPDIEDTRKYEIGQPLIGSNTVKALSYHAIARQLGIYEIPVLSFAQVVQYWPFIFERDSTYADTCEVAIFPNRHEDLDNEKLRIRTLNLLGLKGTAVPLIVSGLVPVRDEDNKTYGFQVNGEDSITYAAPFLEHDCKVRWDGKKVVECKEGEEGIKVWTPDSQSGFRRLYRDGSGRLIARVDNLLYSDGSGRVPVLFEPKARAQNLEGKV